MGLSIVKSKSQNKVKKDNILKKGSKGEVKNKNSEVGNFLRPKLLDFQPNGGLKSISYSGMEAKQVGPYQYRNLENPGNFKQSFAGYNLHLD